MNLYSIFRSEKYFSYARVGSNDQDVSKGVGLQTRVWDFETLKFYPGICKVLWIEILLNFLFLEFNTQRLDFYIGSHIFDILNPQTTMSDNP